MTDTRIIQDARHSTSTCKVGVGPQCQLPKMSTPKMSRNRSPLVVVVHSPLDVFQLETEVTVVV